MPEKIKLDEGSYEDRLKKALDIVSQKAPGWTHREASDPGVTLLELWALLADMQSFYLDQVQESHYRKYLKLLGADEDAGESARTRVSFDGVSESCTLPRGTKLLADKMVFETEEEITLTDNHVKAFYLPEEDGKERDRIHQLRMKRKHAFPLRDTAPLFTFVLEKPVKRGDTLSFFVLLDEREKRNRTEDKDFCMARLSWKYPEKGKYRKAVQVLDETHGLLYSGEIKLRIEGCMDWDGSCGGYPVRCEKEEGMFDVFPVLYKLSLNTAEAVQQNTLCCEETAVIGPDATGLALKSYLGLTGELMVFRECAQGEWEDITGYCESTPPVTGSMRERYVEWKKLPPDKLPLAGGTTVKIVCSAPGFQDSYRPVEITGVSSQETELPCRDAKAGSLRLMLRAGTGRTLFHSYEKREPEDTKPRAFHEKEGENRIVFGDGRHGEIPVQAKDGLVVTGLVSFAGSRGNAAIGKISGWEREDLFQNISCSNLLPAKGGRDAKKPSQVFAGLSERWQQVQRAVTEDDFALLAMQTPGLIVKDASAQLAHSHCVRVEISLPAQAKSAFCRRKYEEEVRKYLEGFRIVTGGIEVKAREEQGEEHKS